MVQTIKANRLTGALLEELRQLSTCVTASAIETFGVRMHNAGFANSSIGCIFEELPPVVGYAATARIRCTNPPTAMVSKDRGYHVQNRTAESPSNA